jgi:hypothetical protein
MNNHQQHYPSRLCAIVGAGDLVSHIHRIPENDLSSRYRFNLIRVKADADVTGSFRPDDLRDIVKACQVIAFEIANDGWISGERQELLDLASGLDTLTQSWERSNEE